MFKAQYLSWPIGFPKMFLPEYEELVILLRIVH